jgi:hypothetical protein
MSAATQLWRMAEQLYPEPLKAIASSQLPVLTRSVSRLPPLEPRRMAMSLRTTSKTISFARPFSLDGLDETQLAGSYTVQTDEEPIEGLSFLAYRRVATVIFLPLTHGGAGSFQAIPVAPDALDAALARDASGSHGS